MLKLTIMHVINRSNHDVRHETASIKATVSNTSNEYNDVLIAMKEPGLPEFRRSQNFNKVQLLIIPTYQ